MFIYDAARKINSYRKIRKKAIAGQHLSPVRRIERTAPLKGVRHVAMTFDDGPCAVPPGPWDSGTDQRKLTEVILDALNKYNAKATFNVIGTTEDNYPDKRGNINSFSWGGLRFDHYPDFQKDSLAGVKNQIGLAARMVAEGHELSNHGYRHILFGPMKLVYRQREYFKKLQEVIDDLWKLHSLVLKELNYTIRLARPPHYIDKIPDSHSAYDAFSHMGYQYLAASYDGGGWKATCGSYEKDVDGMVRPLEEALLKDPSCLNGQIIFHKDGCNMSKQTPVAHSLEKQLKLLSEAGYKVLTVSELIALSPFEDIDDSDPAFESVRYLAGRGFCIGYRNNTFQADRVLTKGELGIMLTPHNVSGHVKGSTEWALLQPCFKAFFDSRHRFNPEEPVSAKEFESFLDKVLSGKNISWSWNDNKNSGMGAVNPARLRRRDVIDVLCLIDKQNAIK